MNIEQAIGFLRDNHWAVLATTRSDGRPATSPVTVAVDENGRVMISSRETAMKVRHIRRDPRVSLCVLNPRFYGEFAQLEGEAELVPLPEALELLVDYYRRAAGEHPDWDDYRRAMVEDKRVLIRFEITRAGPTVSG